MVPIIGSGVYNFADAASLTGLRTGRVREWFRTKRTKPVFTGDYGDETQQRIISFLDLIEVFVAGQLRERPVLLLPCRGMGKRRVQRLCLEIHQGVAGNCFRSRKLQTGKGLQDRLRPKPEDGRFWPHAELSEEVNLDFPPCPARAPTR